jgi:O-antigen/teichoic acid export membrane protein
MSEREEIRDDVNRGLGWVGLASTLVSLLDFIAIIIILAFWISKEQYGIATKAVWMFPILDLATDLGLSAAVIQRDDHTESKISTVFWMNLAMSLIMFGGLWAASPLLTSFYGHTVVGSMIVVYGTKLIWQNAYFIPQAMMRRELRYREISIIRVVANVAEFTAKIGTAFAGYGVWCFVIGPMCRVAITGIGTQICHPWRPRFIIKLHEAYDYLKFGLKQSSSQMLFYFYTNIDYPIVGYYFGDVALGLYRWAYEVVLEPVRIISHVVVEVAFPAFSRLKYSRDKLVEQFIQFTRLNLVTAMSFVAVVFIVGDEFNYMLFGTEYLASGPAIRVLCAVGVLRALGYVVPPLLDGMGYPGHTLVYQITASIALPSLFLGFAIGFGDQLGFLSVAIAWAVGYPIAFGVLALLGLSRLELRLGTYLRRVGGIPLCTAAAMGIGALVRWATLDLTPSLRFGLVTGSVVAVLSLLLAYTQGISPRAVARALKGEPPNVS